MYEVTGGYSSANEENQKTKYKRIVDLKSIP